MNREILFRGFHERSNGDIVIVVNGKQKQGEWVYGYLINNEKDFYIFTNNEDIDGYFEGWFTEVIPETVGQFIGLMDKNKNKIFEGDILKGYQYPFCSDGDFNYYAEVIWFDDSPAFGLYTFKNKDAKVRGISEGNTDYIENFNSNDWEVIGTIYDKGE